MKDNTKSWLKYSEENLEAAKILIESSLFNPSLHNVQQSIEKSIKSLFIEYSVKLKKSHSISELMITLKENSIDINLSEDETDLLDSIYLPSKYPFGSALPDYFPDAAITIKCITIAERVLTEVRNKLAEE